MSILIQPQNEFKNIITKRNVEKTYKRNYQIMTIDMFEFK